MCLRILLGNHQRFCITKLLKLLYPTVQPLLLAVQHPQLAVHCTASPAFRQTSTDVVHFLLLSACSGGVYSLQITTVQFSSFGESFFCFISHPGSLILMIYWTYDLLGFRFVRLIWVSLHMIRKTSKKHLLCIAVIIFLFIRGSEHSAPSSECIYIFCQYEI